MLENQLIKLVISVIKTGLTAAGAPYSELLVQQAQQPTQQGVPLKPAVFLTKLPANRYGFLRRESKWDEDAEKMVHTETQEMESSFQVNVLAIQKPSDENAITPMDYLNRVAAILQSDTGREQFRAQGVGVYRINAERQPFFVDDMGRNEASPSFDFILTHKQVIITETPIVVVEEFNFNRV